MNNFKIEIQMMTGEWKEAGKLAEYVDGKWTFPRFDTRAEAQAALEAAYDMDQYEGCSRIVGEESIEQRIQEVATIENAEQYEVARDQFEFCRGLLGLNAYGYKTEHAVVDLRNEFDSLNNFGMTIADAQQDADQMSAAEQANEYALEGVTNY